MGTMYWDIEDSIPMMRVGQVGGYRDLMLCCLLEGPGGLKIIGEVQVKDKNTTRCATCVTIHSLMCIIAHISSGNVRKFRKGAVEI
jgi:hypothetical protein